MIVDLEKKWLPRAKCKDMGDDAFFADHSPQMKGGPSKAVLRQWEEAKEICIECPVMIECGRDFMGETEGVWGGYDPLERAKLRAREALRIRNMKPGPEKAAYARLAWHLCRTPRYGARETSRIMGLPLGTISYLSDLHSAYLAAEEAEVRRKAAKVQTVELPPAEIAWPDTHPAVGDGWVRHFTGVVHGYYLGETEDGEWFFMKAPLSNEDSMSWFRKRDVKLTRKVTPAVKRRVGKTSRIYGTTISPKYAHADKAG